MIPREFTECTQIARSIGPWWLVALLAIAMWMASVTRSPASPWRHDPTPHAGVVRR